MTVTVAVQEGNGASVTWTTITVGRWMTKDQYTQSDSYPIKIPTEGFKYSFWKHHALYYASGTGTISNIKFYSAGAPSWQADLGTNGMVMVAQRSAGVHGCPAANYDQATGVEGDSGDYLMHADNGHAYYKAQATPVNISTYTSGSVMDVDSSSYTTVGERTYAVVTQVKVAPDAVQGLKDDITLTFRYDEQ